MKIKTLIEPGSFVSFRGSRFLYDEDGRTFRVEEPATPIVLVGFHRKNSKKREDIEYSGILMFSSGKLLRTHPIRLGWHTHDEPTIRLVSSLGLVPHVDMDSFVKNVFSVGYTSMSIGPTGYAGSFGISCKFPNGQEPRTNGSPSVWKIVEEFGAYAGCGGYHSAQMCNFFPTGKYKFGNIVNPHLVPSSKE